MKVYFSTGEILEGQRGAVTRAIKRRQREAWRGGENLRYWFNENQYCDWMDSHPVEYAIQFYKVHGQVVLSRVRLNEQDK